MKIQHYLSMVLLSTILLFTFCTQQRQEAEKETEVPVKNITQEAVETVDIKEWPVPWKKTGTRDPFVAPDGKVWFCGQGGNYIANLDPSSGEFNRYEVPEKSHPHNLIIDKNGFVWYAGNRNAHIGKLDPNDGSIIQYPMPNPEAKDPHTLVFNQEGNIWFTVQNSNFIGHLNTTSGEVRLVAVPTARSRPYGIKIDAQNQPWVVLFGTNKLATVDPKTFELTEIALPNEKSRPRRIEVTSDGSIYYGDFSRGYLGLYNPTTKQFKEWALPGGEYSRPYGTAIDAKEHVWIAESGVQPNRLVTFDPETEEFYGLTEIPSGGITIRHMYYHPSSKEIWFGTDTNNIGRAKVSL